MASRQFQQLPNWAALSHNDCQPNSRAILHLSALHYASSSIRNMAIAIITICSICYKCYWPWYHPLCFPFILKSRLPHLKVVRGRMGRTTRRAGNLWTELGMSVHIFLTLILFVAWWLFVTCFHLDHQNCLDAIKIVLVFVFVPRNGYRTNPCCKIC